MVYSEMTKVTCIDNKPLMSVIILSTRKMTFDLEKS